MNHVSFSTKRIICNHRLLPDHSLPVSELMERYSRKAAPEILNGGEKTTSFGGVTLGLFLSIVVFWLLKQPFEFALPIPEFPTQGNFICNHKANW